MSVVPSRKQAGQEETLGKQSSNGTRADAEGGDLAAAASDVGEAGGAQTSQKAADSSAEKIGCEIDEHVAVINLADIGDIGKYFVADGNALLNDPGAIFCGEGAADGGIPVGFVCFPTESYAGAAVLVAWLEHKIFALLADEREKFDLLAIMGSLHVCHDARPRDMRANQIPFLMRKKGAILF